VAILAAWPLPVKRTGDRPPNRNRPGTPRNPGPG
jgi:hypothetical protein